MNERIEKLAEQSLQEVTSLGTSYYSGTLSVSKGFTDKFAELIVAEMCGLMEQAEDDAYHCFEPAERPTEYIEWLTNWRTQFEEHFGVEP